jgi:hypothetical protein
MRNFLDPKRFYKSADSKSLPTKFEVGVPQSPKFEAVKEGGKEERGGSDGKWEKDSSERLHLKIAFYYRLERSSQGRLIHQLTV